MLMFCICTSHATAQTFPVFKEKTVAYVNWEQLFLQSTTGQALLAQNEQLAEEIRTELRQIERDLTTEEDRLVQERKTDDPAVFKIKAANFDVKVKRIRSEQAARGRALTTNLETARTAFYDEAKPILRRLMAERGIMLLLDQTSVIIALENSDITADAIDRINQELAP